jgi:UDP-2-acetamido-3-amino-2,3-dideoxy-glucuronate N-acetyltransferase
LTTEKKFYVHPTAEVSEKAKIGDGTKIWHQAQVREGVEIGANCIISKSVYIDFGVKIGNNCKVQNFVSVYHGVTVEDDVFLGPSCTLTNDMYPRATDPNWVTTPTLIKKGASVGANATIVCGITLGEYCMVGAGAVVPKDVPPHTLVVGNPARAIGYVCKCGARAKNVQKKGGVISFACEKCKETITFKG